VFNTVLVNKKKIGGLYIITFNHIATFGALVVTLLEHFKVHRMGNQQSSSQPLESTEEREGHDTHEESTENGHTETTPLIHRRRDTTDTTNVREGGGRPFWVLEYLLLVPFPVILVIQMATMLLGSLPQTLADGSPSLFGTPIILLMRNLLTHQ
jgi:hypothetical protein